MLSASRNMTIYKVKLALIWKMLIIEIDLKGGMFGFAKFSGISNNKKIKSKLYLKEKRRE